MSGDDERWDEPAANDDEVNAAIMSEAHDGALLAFVTNFELVKKLVDIIGWEKIPVEGQRLLFDYLSHMVDGADGFIDQEAKDGTHTTELTTLFREINEARDWLAAHMETE